jgi:hypothetical protein
VNAPAKIAPSRDRYIPIVKHHLPHCEGKELSLRCSILLMRDKATSSARHCSDEAYPLLSEIGRLATVHAYGSMPIESLELLQYELLRLTSVASGLEGFAFALAGGNDAGG